MKNILMKYLMILLALVLASCSTFQYGFSADHRDELTRTYNK